MGVYDYATGLPEIRCVWCKEPIDEFQTSDGPGCMRGIPFEELDEFYGACNNCCGYLHFVYKPDDNLAVAALRSIASGEIEHPVGYAQGILVHLKRQPRTFSDYKLKED
jgi:hypothetical protein